MGEYNNLINIENKTLANSMNIYNSLFLNNGRLSLFHSEGGWLIISLVHT